MPPKTTSKSKTSASKSETAEEKRQALKEAYSNKMKSIMTNIANKLPSDPNEKQRVLKSLGKKIDENPTTFESIPDTDFETVATDTMNAIKTGRAAKTIAALKKVAKTKKGKKTKKPATKKPPTKKPATKKPATKKPATKKPATKKAAPIIDKTTQLIIDAFSGGADNFNKKNALAQVIKHGTAFVGNDTVDRTTIAEAAQRVKNASEDKDESNGGLDTKDIGLFLYGYRGGIPGYRIWYGGALGEKKENTNYPSDSKMRTTLKNLIKGLDRAARAAARNNKKADAKAEAAKKKADAKADAKKKAVEDAKQKLAEKEKQKLLNEKKAEAERLKKDTCETQLKYAKNLLKNLKEGVEQMEKDDLVKKTTEALKLVENQQKQCKKTEFDKKFDEIKEEIRRRQEDIIEKKEKEVKELLKEMEIDLNEMKKLINEGDNASTLEKMEAFKEKKKDNKIILSFDTTGSLKKLMKRKKKLYGILEQNIKEQKCNNKLKKEKEAVAKLEETIKLSTEKSKLEKMYEERIENLNKDAKDCNLIGNEEFKELQTRLKEKYEKRVKELEKPVDEIVEYIIKTFSGGEDGDNPENALEQLIKHGEAFGEKFENTRVINDTTKTKAAERVKNASEKKRADRDGLNKSDIGLFLYGHQGGLPFRIWYGGATGTHKKPPYEKIDDMRQKIKELIDPKEAERKKELQAEQKLKEQERKKAEQEAELEKKQKKAEREKQQKEAELKAEQERLQQEREANLQAELEEQKAEREKKAEQERKEAEQKAEQERLEQKQKEAELKAEQERKEAEVKAEQERKEAEQEAKLQAKTQSKNVSTAKGPYVFAKVQYLEGDIKIKKLGNTRFTNFKDKKILEIINIKSTGKGFAPQLVHSIIEDFKKDNYDIDFIILSPYLQKNPVLHEVYHDKWKMNYVQVNEEDREVLEKKGFTTIDSETSRYKFSEGLVNEGDTYMIISKKKLLENERFKNKFSGDLFVDTEKDRETVATFLGVEEYKRIIIETKVHNMDDSKNIVDTSTITNEDKVVESLNNISGGSVYLYFSPLGKDSLKKVTTNVNLEKIWTMQDLNKLKGRGVQRIATKYNKENNLTNKDKGYLLRKKGESADDLKRKIVNAKVPRRITADKLYDLHSIWDDQEELLPPPPSTLGLADRKAREFMVFE